MVKYFFVPLKCSKAVFDFNRPIFTFEHNQLL
jgi:hypothetical protein